MNRYFCLKARSTGDITHQPPFPNNPQRISRPPGTPNTKQTTTPHLSTSLDHVILQARKKSTKINFLGPETAWWGGGLPREGAVAKNFVPSLESLSSLGFETMNESGMSREFGRDVPDPWGCSKSLCKKVRAHFSFPNPCQNLVSASDWPVVRS